MTPRDFDHLVGLYLDGEASRAQVLALREAMRANPELRARLAAHVRLHRAQVSAPRRSLASSLAGLRAFAARSGLALAHACVLLLVVVELDVALPRIDTQSWAPAPVRALPEPVSAPVSPELPAAVAAPDELPLPEVREADFLDS